ncbi:MAG: DNA gyrase inhibitor YacG [Kiloniellaceae bacterium]
MSEDDSAGRARARPPKKGRSAARCPICGAPTKPEVRPFCSPRCADVDLGRWLRGAYRIPTGETPGDEPADQDIPDGEAPPRGSGS